MMNLFLIQDLIVDHASLINTLKYCC